MSASTTTTSYFCESDKTGSEPLKATRKKVYVGGHRRGIVQPNGLMSSTHLQHQGQKVCDKLVDKARIAGIPDTSPCQILPGKSITTCCGLRLKANDFDVRPQLMYLHVQCLKPWYATANKPPESSVYITLRGLTATTAQVQIQLRAFIVSELEDDSLPSVQALVKGHHVHVDYIEECLQALHTCIQSFQRVRPKAQAPRATCLDTDTSPVKLAAMVKDGMDFAALVERNDRQNAEERRANRLVLMEISRILGVPFQPQVSESSGQSVCQCVFIVQWSIREDIKCVMYFLKYSELYATIDIATICICPTLCRVHSGLLYLHHS
jgi:hypothetical protein